MSDTPAGFLVASVVVRVGMVPIPCLFVGFDIAVSVHLVVPDVRYQASYFDMVAEFQNESLLDYERIPVNQLRDPSMFSAYVEALRARRVPETARPEGHVPETVLWWVRGDEVLADVSVRHYITDALTNRGGHIGYSVRPSARRQGHATALVGPSLRVAAELGIQRALITCSVDNVASRRAIERNGGELEDERKGTLRFWTASPLSREGEHTFDHM